MSTCRLCSERRGHLIKYGVRHYSHAECALSRWGADFFDMLSQWQLEQFPVMAAAKYNLIEALTAKIEAARHRNSSSTTTG